MWLTLFVSSLFFHSCFSQQRPIPIIYDHTYDNFTTQGELMPNIYELQPAKNTSCSVRVCLRSVQASSNQPISLTLMRGAASLLTVLPRIQTIGTETREYKFLAETLCEQRNTIGETLTESNDTVRISISSSFATTFSLRVEQVFDYVLKLKKFDLSVSPPSPIFYRFHFPEIVDAITIQATSSDLICGRLTIQKADCPVFDTEGQVVSFYNDDTQQTFTKNSFMIIKKADFGSNIHVIFSVLPTDSPCWTKRDQEILPTSSSNETDRTKKISVEIKSFHQNVSAVFVIFAVFFVAIGMSAAIVWRCYKVDNNFNPDDSEDDGTHHFWNLSLAQLFVVFPVALIVISIRYAYTELVTDMDTCNFNFECSIPLLNFKAFNNMLSAASIAVAAIINIIFSVFMKRQRRFFPLNSCIFLTGSLWTMMNICPQRHSYHLYTMSMIMTVLEAKFLLFGMRVGRKITHYRFTGSFMMILMIWNILDTNLESTKLSILFCALTVATNFCYAVYFSYSQGNEKLIFLFHRLGVKSSNAHHEHGAARVPVIPEGSLVPLPVSTSTEQYESISSHIMEDTFDAPSTSASSEQLLSGQDLGEDNSANEIRNIRRNGKPVYAPPRQKLLDFYFIATIISTLVWLTLAILDRPDYDSARISLRIIQTDFALYFIFYCLNKFKEPHIFTCSLNSCSKTLCLYVTTCLFIAGIGFWFYISKYKLPAYVPWSPAASRTLNASCFSDILGMGWYDLFYYTTMGICILYPIMVHKIDHNVDVDYERVVF
ncbi:unnamed protein product [Caenorhabditis brenneri]